MPCREAEALKAALRENEALLHGVDAAHELADVATATAEVLPHIASDACAHSHLTVDVAQRHRLSCQASSVSC